MKSADLAQHIKDAHQLPGGEWQGRCPCSDAHSHGDAKPSLSWRDKDDRILMSCKAGAGCKNADIMARLGLTLADLFHHPKHQSSGKWAPIVATYDYNDENGALNFQVLRHADKTFTQRRPDGNGGWVYKKANRQTLYNLDKVQGQKAVAATEGEKDADRLTGAGVLAVCNAMGAKKWTDAHTAQLKDAGVEAVFIFRDNDGDGSKHAEAIESSCLKHGIFPWQINLPGLPPKGDVSDWLDDADESHNIGELKELLKVAAYTSGWVLALPEHEPDADAEELPVAATDRPTVTMTGDLAADTDEAWKALLDHNDPPVLFHYGDSLVRLVLDASGNRVLRVLNGDRLRLRLSRVAVWVKLNAEGERRAIYPPSEIVSMLLADEERRLPTLRRIADAPVFAEDGRLIDAPGYDAASGVLYNPPKGFTVPSVPEAPTADDVAAARSLILDDMLVDFPFVGDADRAAVVAFLLTTFTRGLFHGVAPLFMFDKPQPRTGASLLVDIVTMAALGRKAPKMAEAATEDEWRKRITSALLEAPPFFVIDNLRHGLDSAVLSAAMTTETWRDRVLGVTREVTLPVTCAWVATANNPQMSKELAARTVPCRLDAKMERPEDRTKFKHHPIDAWVEQNRAQIVHACLVLVQNWIAKGRPPGKAVLGGFHRWADTVGGILDAAGIPSLLSNVRQFSARVVAESDNHRAFVMGWHEAFGTTKRYPKDLMLTAETAGYDLDAKSDKGRVTKLGNVLKKMEGKVIGGFQVTRLDHDSGGTPWKLVEMKPKSESDTSDTPDTLQDRASKKNQEQRGEGVPPTPFAISDGGDPEKVSKVSGVSAPAEDDENGWTTI